MGANSVPKVLAVSGLVLLLIAALWYFFGKALPFGRLPGDLTFVRGNTRVYIPITTCILASVVVSLLLRLIRFLNRE